jgi:hypothetical protein
MVRRRQVPRLRALATVQAGLIIHMPRSRFAMGGRGGSAEKKGCSSVEKQHLRLAQKCFMFRVTSYDRFHGKPDAGLDLPKERHQCLSPLTRHPPLPFSPFLPRVSGDDPMVKMDELLRDRLEVQSFLPDREATRVPCVMLPDKLRSLPTQS